MRVRPSSRFFAYLGFALFVLWPALGLAQVDKAAPAAAPDVLTFTNGDKLTGKLIRTQGSDLLFHSDMAGDLTVPLSKVKELTSSSEFVALRTGKPGHNPSAGSGTVALNSDQVTLTKDTNTINVASKDLAYLIDAPTYNRELAHTPNFRKGWTGAATAGFTLVRSTQSSTTFTGALNMVRQVPTVDYLPRRNRTLVNIQETYGINSTPIIPQTVPASPPVTVKTNIFHADGERDEYFTQRAFGLADLAFEHNFAQGLQFQQIYGVGVGWTPVQDSVQQLDLKADIHYERQQFVTASSNQVLVGSTFQENYQRTLPRTVVFTEWANILPAWNNTNAYSANLYLGLAMPVFKRLSISLSATDNYLNNPSPGFRKNAVQFVTGVSYSFK